MKTQYLIMSIIYFAIAVAIISCSLIKPAPTTQYMTQQEMEELFLPALQARAYAEMKRGKEYP